MYRAFTLIEILITLVILVISIYFISPVIFHLHDSIALKSEIKNLQSFLYQIQTKARYTKQSYALTISQNIPQKVWCVIAVQKENDSKKQIVCDCLNMSRCALNQKVMVYRNTHKNIVLKNKSLYPNSFINIDGLAGRLEAKCLYLEINRERRILQLDQWGRIYVTPKDKRSTCKD